MIETLYLALTLGVSLPAAGLLTFINPNEMRRNVTLMHEAAMTAPPGLGPASRSSGGLFLVPSPPAGERVGPRRLRRHAAHPAFRADPSAAERGDSDVRRYPSPTSRIPELNAEPGRVLEVRQDEWIGNDKLRHFLMSMAVTQFAYGGLRTADMKDDLALPIAIGVAAVTGVGKEVHDVRNDGPFSLKDLAWDAAGILAAGVLLGSVR